MVDLSCATVVSHEELAVSLLNQKYNDNFEVDRVQGQSVLDGYYTAIAYQVDNPDIPFRVTVNSDGSGESDNYVGKLVCVELSDRIGQNLADLNGIFYIYSVTLIDSLELSDPSITLDQYIADHPKMKYGVYLNYDPDEMNADEFYNSLQHCFDELEPINGSLFLYIMDDDMLKQVQNYLETYDKMYDGYKSMVSPYYAGVIPFEDGKLTCTREDVEKMVNGC